MRPLRILVANEPRAYREALARTLQQLRPRLDVVEVEPAQFDGVVAGLAPDIVICSRRGACPRGSASACVVLYPAGEARVVVRVFGECTVAADLDLDDLLSIVDRTARLAPFEEWELAQMS